MPKHPWSEITLIAGFGVDGDYHAGEKIRHRYLAKKDPLQPNHRQILMVDEWNIAEIAEAGITALPGQMGENLYLTNIGLMQLSVGTQLQIGECLIELTEIRHPCWQLNAVHPDLLETVMPFEDDPSTYNAGMLGVVIAGGQIKPGDTVFY